MSFPRIQKCCDASRPISMPTSIPRHAIIRPQWRSAVLSRIPSSAFSTSPVHMRDKRPKGDTRIKLIRYFLKAPKTPRVLRLSRLRSLRHWTIHRAWQLHKEKMRKAQELDLERQYNSMRHACEQLRIIGDDGMVGGRNEGRLYRVAMEKKGIWQGIPIEYSRLQTEWPSREGWNHEWTRG